MILRSFQKTLKHFILLSVILCLWSPGLKAADFSRMVDGTFEDGTRRRTVPFRAYCPNPLQGTYPVVLFSHGLGGSRNAAAYLGRYLAENGYIAFHIQHPGSDVSIWLGKGSDRQGIMAALKWLRNDFVKTLHEADLFEWKPKDNKRH